MNSQRRANRPRESEHDGLHVNGTYGDESRSAIKFPIAKSWTQRRADDFLFGARKNMSVGKRGRSPGQFSAAKRERRIHQTSPTDFLVTLGAEMAQNQFSEFVVNENRASVHGHVHAGGSSGFLASHLVSFPDLRACIRVEAD